MMQVRISSFTVIALAVGSAVVGSSWLERTERTQTSTTPPEVRLLQCVSKQDTLATGPGSVMAAYCESAYAENLKHANWPALYNIAWR